MKTLIIDNHTKHVSELVTMFPGSDVVVKENLKNTSLEKYDLLVFSGGSHVPTVLHHTEIYSEEISIIQKATIPILGICLGSEIIIDAFGGELNEISALHQGDMKLTIIDESLSRVLKDDDVTMYEAHCVTIKKLPDDFMSCAVSDHGIEIFKHATKPIIGIQFHPEVGHHEKLIQWVLTSLGF